MDCSAASPRLAPGPTAEQLRAERLARAWASLLAAIDDAQERESNGRVALVVLLGCALAALGASCPTPKPHPTPTPTPSATATPTPSPTPQPLAPFTAAYLGAGSRWETQTGIGWLHRVSRPWTTVLRFGGWDCEPAADTPHDEMLACTRQYLDAIRREGDPRKYIAVFNYLPGRTCGAAPPMAFGGEPLTITPARVSEGDFGRRLIALPRVARTGTAAAAAQYVVEDCLLESQFATWRPYWSDVVAAEWIDEFGGTLDEAQAVRTYWYGLWARMGMEPRPLYAAATGDQILAGSAWQASDLVGIELYAAIPCDGPLADITSAADAQLARIVGAGKRAVAVIQAYSRNYDCGAGYVPRITHAGFAWATAHRPRVVGTMPFSIARPSGALEYPDVLAQVRRGHALFLGLPDPGPEAPAPTPEPTPEPPSGPGDIQPNRKATMVDPGVSALSVRIIRTGGQDGVVTVRYATHDSTGRAGSEYVAQSGVLTFADGIDAQDITLALLPTPLSGTWEAEIMLSEPGGGARLADGYCRFGQWGKGSVIGFQAPVLRVAAGNSTVIALRRDGRTDREARAKIVGDIRQPVDAWLYWSVGEVIARTRLETDPGDKGLTVTLSIVAVEGGTLSDTTPTQRVEVR